MDMLHDDRMHIALFRATKEHGRVIARYLRTINRDDLIAGTCSRLIHVASWLDGADVNIVADQDATEAKARLARVAALKQRLLAVILRFREVIGVTVHHRVRHRGDHPSPQCARGQVRFALINDRANTFRKGVPLLVCVAGKHERRVRGIQRFLRFVISCSKHRGVVWFLVQVFLQIVICLPGNGKFVICVHRGSSGGGGR